MPDYSKLREGARKQIRNSGQKVKFKYSIGGTENVATGSVTSGTNVSFEAYAVASRFKNSEINGDTILSSDVKLITEDLEREPEAGWTVVVKGTEYRVQNVMPLNPAGDNLIYTIQLRI